MDCKAISLRRIPAGFTVGWILWAFLVSQPTAASAQQLVIRDRTGEELALYESSHALVIGQSQYTAGWPVLPGVVEDVNQVRQLFEAHGFEVEMAMDLDDQQFRQAIEDFITQRGLDSKGRLLVYYAGHGHTERLAYGDEMGYLVPTNAPNPHVDRNGFLAKAMPMDQIEVYAKRIQTNHVLFLFDSCFSGSIFSLSRAIPENISYKTTLPVRQFITSGSADEQVPDESVFRSQLISALRGEGDSDRDGYVTGTELGEFLQKKVVNYSKSAQHPQYGKIRNPNLDKGDYVFALGGQVPAPEPPRVKKADYSDLEARSQSKERWQPYQRSMQEEFETVANLEENLAAPADRAEAWQRFLNNYQRDNPFSAEDDRLRGEARNRLDRWQVQARRTHASPSVSSTARLPSLPPPESTRPTVTPTLPSSKTQPRLLVLLTDSSGTMEAGVSTAETALLGGLIDAGFPVVDASQVELIRRNEADLAAILAADEARIAAISQQHGAEVMVVGSLQSEAEPAVGRFFTGRAVLNLRMYRASSGQYLGASTVQIGGGEIQGAMGPSEMTARSAACTAAGQRGAAVLAEQAQLNLRGQQELVVVAMGVSASDARLLRELLAGAAGVQSVSQRYFVAGERVELGVEFSGDAMALGDSLEGRSLGSRRLRLAKAEPWRLTLRFE